MILHFTPSQSTVMPKLLDTESSKTHVFIRQNIHEEPRSDENGSLEPQRLYVYEEAVLTKQEYLEYLNETLQAENEELKTQLSEHADALVELASILSELDKP